MYTKIVDYYLDEQVYNQIQEAKSSGKKVKLNLKVSVRTNKYDKIKINLIKKPVDIKPSVKPWECAPALVHCVLQDFVECRKIL